MILNYQILGQGTAVVLLHGLFGSLDNLQTTAKSLHQAGYQVINIDLRNHGLSLHETSHTYPDLIEDVKQTLDSLNIETFFLLGHSMGGKTAMLYALTYPKQVLGLIVEDIAPVNYPDGHSHIFKALETLNLTQLNSRKMAEETLNQFIDEPSIVQFLLKSLMRHEQSWRWKFNLTALKQNYLSVRQFPSSSETSNAPTLFIKGGESDYINEQYLASIKQYFPQATFKIVQGCGHWIHAQKPSVFNKIALDFIQNTTQI